MKHPVRLALFLALLAAPALADLPEPPVNTGATSVEVEGTKVKAEAWAVALGHDVEAIVVARFVPSSKEGGEPEVETYERWSVDGRKKFERGNRKLGREWEKKLWKILEEAEKELSAEERKQLPRGREDLLERLGRSLGKSGSKPVEGAVIAWSITSGRMDKNGRRTSARTAVVTFSAPGPDDDLTPREDEPSEGRGPVTPGEGTSPPNLPFPTGGSGSGSASGSGSGRTVVDTERGIREHVLVEADLQRRGGAPPREDDPRGEITPGER